MIDGVKIEVLHLNGCKWFDNKYLDFYTYTNNNTGELLDNTMVAKCRGLKFYITKSSKYTNRNYYSVRGSLHKYFNNGRHNANDFTFENLQKVLKELHQKFNIDPQTSILRNLEFGVNINTPVTAKEVLKNLVSYGCYTFGTLKIEGVSVGKKIDKQKSSIKIYDKGKQYKKDITNLARFEVAVRKMIFLKPYGITTLSDLQDATKIAPLGRLLNTYWDDVIYYDKVVNWKVLTEFERKKLLYYATPLNWSEFSRMQRMRAKKHFKELMNQYSTSTTHKNIGSLIGAKWNDLTAEMCIRLTHDVEPKKENDLYTFEPLEYTVQTYTNDTSKKELKFCPKTPLKKARFKTKKCCVCGSDISHKKAKAKYCSKKCNNVLNGQKRTTRNRKIIAIEKTSLERLLKILSKNKLWLLITYKTETGNYTDYLHQSEINTSTDWIRKIQNATITGHRKNSKTIILTSYRIRKLIKTINHINQ